MTKNSVNEPLTSNCRNNLPIVLERSYDAPHS